MKFEQDLVGGADRHAHKLPDGVVALKKRVPTTEARREIRLATDALIHEAINANVLPPLLHTGCDVMLTLARALNRHDLDPQVPHFIEAARALVEDARTIVDAGLRVDDMDKAQVGAVMIEIAIRGIFATLGQDYERDLAQHFMNTGELNGFEQTTAASGGPGVDLGDDDRPPDRAA